MQHPWDRRDAESSRAFKCFAIFRDAGADRSVIRAYRQETGKKQARNVPGSWNAWVLKFEWQERAVAYDNHLAEIELEERRRAIKRDETKWALRRMKFREREFAASEKLITAAEAILAQQYLAEQQDVTRMMKLGVELQRRATDYDKHADDDVVHQGTGAKIIRFPIVATSADEWSSQYKKKA